MMLASQNEAFKVFDAPAEILGGLDEQMKRKSDGALYYLDRIWVPLTGDVRPLIIDEAHKSMYSVHPGADKMYYDLWFMYWWPGMKKDIAMYVSKCLTCLKSMQEALGTQLDMSMAYHSQTDGQREHTIQTLEDMLRALIMEYLVKISKKACILKLKRRHLKITVMTSNMPYPSRKIRLTMTKKSRESSRNLSLIDDDLFTYEVEIAEVTNIPCDLKKEDDSEQQMSHESDDDMEYDPSDVEFTEWLAFHEITWVGK
uniref:Putative reverse transcriptase domain-containing protein n=1 Tax=Tanacetum cinerariifolium TaxID=118510 RepID=A0A699GPG7_TANCI|nr:putative reverse transcriptase domain-containing protein [Tanacetum cinerariifolium]